MEDERPGGVTGMLRRFQRGEAGAADRLIEAVYPELQRVAARILRAEHSQTLQPAALVNEAYLKLIDQRDVDWQGRTHFFSLSARLMCRILVDHARERLAQKRGGVGKVRITLDANWAIRDARLEDIIAVNEALTQLRELDERQAELVELRFFAGLKLEDAADALGISVPTAKRDWAVAKAWLRRRMTLAEGKPG